MTENNADRLVFVRLFDLLIQRGKIKIELAEVRRFEFAAFQFNSNKALQVTVKKKQID